MRLAVYGATSTLVGVGVIVSAFNQRANFYSACVHLAQSTACLIALTNLLFLISMFVGHILQLIFYGPLRAIEIEHLYEKAWYAVTETCLAMTIFRDEFDVRFIVMFGVLLFVKCFCWIGGGRVEFMEQTPPANPTLFHIRLSSSLALLLFSCSTMLWHSVSSCLELGRPNMMVMFAFEFAILLITSLGITGRYVLSLVEKLILKKEAERRREARALERQTTQLQNQERRADVERRRAAGEAVTEAAEEVEVEEEEDDDIDVGGWEEKGTWVFYSELVTDLLKLLTYLSFFAIVLTYYGLPLHIIRDVYLTLRSFITRIRDFIRYRRATAHMNSRYPDATTEEVEREGVCIICREEMRAWTEGVAGEGGRAAGTQDQRSRPKKLPCGHVLHFACLRSWLERQQRCPTCRRPVLDEVNPPATPVANNNGNNAAAPAQGQPAAGGRGGGGGGRGVAFGAQIGPLGFDIGVGGPGFVQNLMNRMNAQNRPQQAQPQPQPQQPQAQPAQPQPGAQPPGTPGRPMDFQQRITNLRYLIERESTVLEIMQRQLRELTELQQAVLDGAPLPHLLPVGVAAALGGGLPPGTRVTGAGVYRGGQLMTGTNVGGVLPAGMTLPPGWNMISLTGANGATNVAAPGTPATPGIALRGAELLRGRRGQRSYRTGMRDHHTRMTPARERTQEEVEFGARPALTRVTSAPVVPTGPLISPSPDQSEPAEARGASREAKERESLSPSQYLRLSPTVQRSVAAVSVWLQNTARNEDLKDTVKILAGLPQEFRSEVLEGWPDRSIASSLVTKLVKYQELQPEAAVQYITLMLSMESFMTRIRILLGLPSDFRAEVIAQLPKTDESRAVQREVDILLGAVNALGNTSESSPPPPPLEVNRGGGGPGDVAAWTEVQTIPEGSSREEIDRADRETRELVNRRVETLNNVTRTIRAAAQALERTTTTAPLTPTISLSTPPPGARTGLLSPQIGNFNMNNPLSLFGDRSIFPLTAQQEALRRLEREVVDQEREWRLRKVIENMLDTSGSSNSASEEILNRFGASGDMVRGVIRKQQQQQNGASASTGIGDEKEDGDEEEVRRRRKLGKGKGKGKARDEEGSDSSTSSESSSASSTPPDVDKRKGKGKEVAMGTSRNATVEDDEN